MTAASISKRRPRAAKQQQQCARTTPNVSVLCFLLLLCCCSSVASALNHEHRHDGTETERDAGPDLTQQQQQDDPNARDMQVIVDGFVDSDRCWGILNDSDANADGRVDKAEYVDFAQQLEEGVIDDVDEYADLPLAYVASFTATACLCNNPLAGGDPDAVDCCQGDNAHIRVTVPPSQSPNSTEVNYLYTACSLTTGAAELVQNSPPPLNPPTDMPVVAPTDAPTEAPTESPTDEPTASPTDEPTASPTDEPTEAQEGTSSPTLSPAPTPKPSTEKPTIERERVISLITYGIALENGVEEINDSLWTAEYLSNLIAALNILSVKVAEEGQQRTLRVRRSLAATVIRPTGFETVNDKPCPTDKVISFNEKTLCQEVTAKVRLAVMSEEDQWQFDTDLQQAIVNGELQDELDAFTWEIAGENPVTVLASLEDETDESRAVSSNTNLSPGAISGITIAALFFALVPIGYYIFQRNQPADDKPPYEEYEADEHSRDRVSEDNSLRTDGAQGSTSGPILGATTLGASTADYGKGDVLAEPGLVLEDDDDDDDDGASSSNAGSSGWSSSAGISSLNTGSMDDSADAAVAAGATLAGIGVASAFSRRTAKQQQTQDIVPPSDTDDGASDIHSVSRDQLDQLIEAGDWAAVGATAALLAAASDSQSAQSMQRSTTRSRGSQSADAARAAELDHLVDAGDWEGALLFYCLLYPLVA